MKVKIAFGGSHRKNKRCIALLASHLDQGGCILPRYQSKVLEATAIDSPEMRERLKEVGGTICRHQPAWLNEGGAI